MINCMWHLATRPTAACHDTMQFQSLATMRAPYLICRLTMMPVILLPAWCCRRGAARVIARSRCTTNGVQRCLPVLSDRRVAKDMMRFLK